MPAQFQLKVAKNGKHYFNLLSTNGQVILTSQMYASSAGARQGIASVQANAGDPERYQRRTGKSGKAHFVLRARNNRVIGASEIYNTTRALENGIASVRKNGPQATTMVIQ